MDVVDSDTMGAVGKKKQSNKSQQRSDNDLSKLQRDSLCVLARLNMV